MKKKIIPVLAVIALIFILLLVVFIGSRIRKYMPSKEEQNLYEYFGITQVSNEEGYQELVSSGECVIPIELNREITEEKAFKADGQYYLNYNFVHDTLNDRFYWDGNENVLLYTTASDVIKTEADSANYTIGKKKNSKDYKIVQFYGEETYIALDFLTEYIDLSYEIGKEPERILLQNEWGTITKVSAKRRTQLRVKGGIKSNILAKVSKGDTFIVLEALEKWTKVSSEDGLIGFIQNKRLGEETEETEGHVSVEESFEHQTRDEKIVMAWHQVTNQVANGQVGNVLQNTKGINVLSPTWFYLNDDEGNIANLASKTYVDYCHKNDIEVWALVSNLENRDVSTTEVLTHTSKRENLTKQLIAAAIQYDLDGINVDFEELESAVGEGFIQFIRELSLKCEDNGITLSIDNYVSSDYTRFYDREEQAVFGDYVIVMAYDEHYSGSEEGSVASLGFVTQAADDILDENVPADQVILGIPFYTRIWTETPKDSDGDDAESASEDYVPYDLSSEAVTMNEAMRRIEVNGAEKKWLSDIGQYYAEYESNGNTCKIWLEDVTSIEEKLKVMKGHEFAGAAFWKLGQENSEVWDTVIKYLK